MYEFTSVITSWHIHFLEKWLSRRHDTRVTLEYRFNCYPSGCAEEWYELVLLPPRQAREVIEMLKKDIAHRERIILDAINGSVRPEPVETRTRHICRDPATGLITCEYTEKDYIVPAGHVPIFIKDGRYVVIAPPDGVEQWLR